MPPRSSRRRSIAISFILGATFTALFLLVFLVDPGAIGEKSQGFLSAFLETVGLGSGKNEKAPLPEEAPESSGSGDGSEEEAPGEKETDGLPPVAIEAEVPPILEDLPASISIPPGETVEAGAVAGRIIDIRTGRPLVGASVRATLFRATGVPKGQLLRVAGTPALDTERVKSDAVGGFLLRPLEPEDPQALLHLQVQRSGYLPVSAVLDGRHGADGLWSDVVETEDAAGSIILRKAGESDLHRLDIYLRPAWTIDVQIANRDGGWYSGAPVRIRPYHSHHDLMERGVIVAFSGRLVTKSEEYVIFPDRQGIVSLPFSDSPYELELLDPEHYLVHVDPRSGEETWSHVSVLLPYEGRVYLRADRGIIARHRLVDIDGQPVSDVEIEIALGGMVDQRLRTDAEGYFELGLVSFPPPEQPLGYRNPRKGRLTVLSADYLNRSVVVQLPRQPGDIRIDARPARRLRFRLVTGDPDEPTPVPPRSVVSDLDLIPVRYGRDGIMEWKGALSAPESVFHLSTRGFRPLVLRVPELRPEQRVVDLGDVSLDPGWRKEVRLVSAREEDWESIELSVQPLAVESAVQTYDGIPRSGRITVGGLSAGSYRFAVSGPWIEPFRVEAEILETQLEETLELQVHRTKYEAVLVGGRIPGLSPEDAARMIVVERYYPAGSAGPLTFPPYRLASDGGFGSLRYLEEVRRIEVGLLSDSEWGAAAFLRRDVGPAHFPLGELRYRRMPRAELKFIVNGLGEVAPPLGLSLQGQDGVEAFARYRIDDHLHIDGLRRGPYTLRWKNADAGVEIFSFEMESDQFETEVVRSAHATEEVRVEVSDSSGEPVAGVRDQKVGGVREAKPGVMWVKVTVGAEIHFDVNTGGYLATAVTVDAGTPIPSPITLYRPASAFAEILDSDGSPAEGVLEVSWPDLGPVKYGEPRRAAVHRGRVKMGGLPPLRTELRFALEGSDIAVKRTFTLTESEDPHDLGVIRLEETRHLSGIVRLLDGTPAAKAFVFLAPRDRSFRYPLRESIDPRDSPHRTTADDQGAFRLEGLPLEWTGEWALVARLSGFVNGVEYPVDWASRSRELVLGNQNELSLEVGYRSRSAIEGYRFTLEYHEGDERVVDLGEIASDLLGLNHFLAVRPGLYRVKWGLVEEYDPLPALWEDVILPSGGRAFLRLRPEGKILEGTAYLNGKEVDRGWILLTTDPADARSTRVGRIREGRFTLIDPQREFRAWAAVIPESGIQGRQDIRRGFALPEEVKGYNQSLRRGQMRIDYFARNLTLRFAPEFLLRHPGARLSFTGYEWERGRFRKTEEEDPIVEPIVRFPLLRPGIHRFAVRNTRGSLVLSQAAVLEDDDVIIDIR